MKKENSFQTGNVILVSFAHLVHDVFTAFLAPILPLLTSQLGITYSMAGFLSVVQRIPSLLNPFIGLIADKVSVRYFIILAPLLTAVFMSILGLAPSYPILVVMLFIVGISSTLFHVPAPVMIKRLSGNKVGRGMSFYMLGGEFARTLGPLTILSAVSLWGLEGTYRLIGFGIAASLLLYLKIGKIKISDEFKNRKTVKTPKGALKDNMPFFFGLSMFILFRNFMKGALTMYLPLYFTSRGESLWAGGIALTVIQFSGAVGTLIAGPASDTIGERKTLLTASILAPALMFLFMISEGYIALVLLVPIGIMIFSVSPVMLALVQDAGTEHPSFFNGIYMTLSFGIGSLTILAVGWMGDTFDFNLTYLISAIAAFLSIPFIFFMTPRRSKS